MSSFLIVPKLFKCEACENDKREEITYQGGAAGYT